MTNIVSVPPELVEQWVDLLESHSDQAVFTLAAHWGYTQAVEELEEFLKKAVDTPCNNSMTDKQHPITPPPELVERLQDLGNLDAIALAYQAGADQELEACVSWLIKNQNPRWALALQDARRPKPPSLKEQALEVMTGLEKRCDLQCDLACIRRALEQLDD